MSFLLDPPALFGLGIVLYLAGKWLKLERLAKIIIGIIIVLTFILFSVLLYTDVFRCVFPFVCNGMSGSEFMFHPNLTGIHKSDVPLVAVIVLFALYPLWIYLGYASALVFCKNRSKSKRSSDRPDKVYSFEDVKSKKKTVETMRPWAIVRYPDIKRGIGDSRQAVRAAVNDLGGIRKFVDPTDNVLIKVNICGGVPNLRGTYTSKEVAGHVVDMIREAGCTGRIMICDADMVWTDFLSNAENEGWVKWANERNKQKQNDVELVNLSDTELVCFDFKDKALGLEAVSKEIIDADVIISIPVMKTHMMTGVTLGMKNMYGTLPEIDKAKYHGKGINEVICRINYAFTPNLTIIDGTIGGENIGPLSCEEVDFRTIIASNKVATADVIAAKLMGFKNPLDDIEHLKLGQKSDLGGEDTETDKDIKPYMKSLPPHISDYGWKHSNPNVAKFYTESTKTILRFPGWDTLFNMGSDFLLFDTARLPLLKYFTPAFLDILDNFLGWFIEDPKVSENKKPMRITNMILFSLLAVFSIYGLIAGGYTVRASLEFYLGFLLAIALGAWFAAKMRTKHLAAISLISAAVSYVVESSAVFAGMWKYLDGGAPPLFALFSTPIFIIVIIGLTSYLQDVFASEYVNLKIDTWWLKLAPVSLGLLALVFFMQFEGYLGIATQGVLVMYALFAILSLYYNSEHTLDWNLAFLIIAVALGGTMEYIGAVSGLWSYAFDSGMPVFISFTWALNAWAACGIAQVLGVNMKDANA